MTNREAINLLEEVRVLDDSIYAYNKVYSDALEMALTALEAEEAWYVSHEYPHKEQWIPVSERLPDDLEEVNITWVNHNPEPYYDFTKDKPASGSAVYYKGSWYWYSSTCVDILSEYGCNEMDEIDDAIEVTAWRPLPEPFWEGGDVNG